MNTPTSIRLLASTDSETTWLDVNQYDSAVLETDPIVEILTKIKDELAKR